MRKRILKAPGAFRIFQSKRLKGNAGLPNSRQAAVTYRSLPAEEKRQYEQEGKRQRGDCNRLCGTKPRSALRKANALLKSHTARGLADRDYIDVASDMVNALHQGSTVSQVIEQARAVAKERTKRAADKAERCRLDLERYQRQLGQPQADALVSKLPFLRDMVFAVPCPSGQCFEVDLRAADRSKDCLSWLQEGGNARATHCTTWLDKECASMHGTVGGLPLKETATSSGAVGDPVHATCHVHRMCMAERPNRLLVGLRNCFLLAFNRLFPRSSQRFKALLEGDVHLQFHCQPLVHCAVPAGSALGSAAPAAARFWVHVGLQYQKPRRATFMRVSEASSSETAPTPERKYVKARRYCASWFDHRQPLT